MELHQLRYVVAVAREGSFTKAADSLYLAQPSLSVQVRKLEQELGVRLFQRRGRGVALTAAGEAFLRHAERALFEIGEAGKRAEEIRELRGGRVGIGVLPSVGARLLPDVLARFTQRHPNIEVVLVEENQSVELERMVQEGRLDLALIRMPGPRQGLSARTLAREPMVALVPPGHRLEGRPEVPLGELANERFVGLTAGTGLRELMDQTCARVGFTPRVVVETGQLAVVWGMVNAGIGVSVLPRLAVACESPSVPLAEKHAVRELGVVWRSQQPLSPPAEAFLELLLESTAGRHWAGRE
jgi:LysR family hydrogen peroxide-inducible transcriptional activator